MSDREQESVTPSYHREGDAVVFDRPSDQEEASRQRRENEQHEFARQQVRTNRRLAWFTGALVLATFCTIGVGVWQGTISQKAANAAKDAVDVANRTLAETQASNEQQAALSDEARIASELAARQSVESSERQSNRALDASIANLHQEQRAWVGLTALQSVPVPPMYKGQLVQKELEKTVSSPAKHEFVIINTGRTPATQVRLIFCEHMSSERYVPDTKDEAWMNRFIDAQKTGRLMGTTIITESPHGNEPRSRSAIYDSELLPPRNANKFFQGPWGETSLPSLAPSIPFPTLIGSSEQYVTDGTVIIFGRIIYRDIYSATERITTFCNYTDYTMGYHFSACPVFNDME